MTRSTSERGRRRPAGADVDGARLAEVIAALSLATDMGMGQPRGYTLRSCLLATRLAEALDADERERELTYYLALLRLVGCTADAHVSAAVLGDEVAARAFLTGVDWWDADEVMDRLRQHLGAGRPADIRERLLAAAMAGLPELMGVALAHCEVAERLAARLGFDAELRAALGQMYERWDGRGIPQGLHGEQLARPVRVVQLAQDAEVYYRRSGVEAAVTVAHRRAGTSYDPALVALFARHAHPLLDALETTSVWDDVLAAEPGPRPWLTGEGLDTALAAMADFADLKTPETAGHSSAVSALAAAAAVRCRLPQPDVELVRRAGWVHDLGRVGVSAGIWHKPGPLSDLEWEQVRLHPYYTERILARPAALASLGGLAALHHERLDGSGYHRGEQARSLPATARLLAAADAYCAMTEPRPHRTALGPDEASDRLGAEVTAGRLDGEAAGAVLAATGHRRRPGRPRHPAGLTDREVEVLRLVARGRTTREVARALVISEKTADHHIQHVYAKAGVTTRAAAALFAMENGLV